MITLEEARRLWSQAEGAMTRGEAATAEAVLREMMAGGARGPDVRYLLGYALLAQGRYEEGFLFYQARREVPAFNLELPRFPIPKWSGEPLTGRSLLVWPEQGVGDIIMFARFARRLAEQGAAVTLAVPPSLTRLLSGAGVEILTVEGSIPIPLTDFMTGVGDLPLLCKASLDNLPPPWPVRGPVTFLAQGIGIMTEGAPHHANDQNRSLPTDVAARLLAAPGAVSLHPRDTGARDFQDTADIIAGLAHVITVDTAVAHLAASMGKPTSILLPGLKTDWRWMQGRDTTPWYPSAKLYRQGQTGWDAAVDAAIREAVRPV